MSHVLITYSTNSGSTSEVAKAIATRLDLGGHQTHVCEISQVTDLQNYDAVVIGAPMIFGWQNQARKFLSQNGSQLKSKKVAIFACAMRLTLNPSDQLPQVPLTIDPFLANEPVQSGRLNIKERFTTTGYYLRPMINAAKDVLPVSIAFFNGKLEMFKLSWWQAAFVMIVVQGVPGDYRNWDYINSWGDSLASLL